MLKEINNTPSLGSGMFTISDISHILRIPYPKVNRWIREYWDKKLAKNFGDSYSWEINSNRAVNFFTLIELCICFNLSEAGVRTNLIIEAHKILSKEFVTPHPFASKEILPHISTDSKRIYFKDKEDIIYSLDAHKQFNLNFIKMFFKNIDFNKNSIAERLWPLGKDKNIVVDPARQFGHPVIGKTNIYPETLFNLYKSGEPINFIAFTYELLEKDVKDAIEFCSAA